MNQRICTDRLVLRPYATPDLEPFVSLLSDELVNALTGNGAYPAGAIVGVIVERLLLARTIV